MLKQGQLIKYDDAIWRVDYVNLSRAYIVPTVGSRVVIRDDEGNELRQFESRGRGVNISASSMVEVVGQEPGRVPEPPPTYPQAPEQAPGRADSGPAPTAETADGGPGWHLVKPAAYRAGSLADQVMAYIRKHPGRPSAALVSHFSGHFDALSVTGCLRRYARYGVIEKR